MCRFCSSIFQLSFSSGESRSLFSRHSSFLQGAPLGADGSAVLSWAVFALGNIARGWAGVSCAAGSQSQNRRTRSGRRLAAETAALTNNGIDAIAFRSKLLIRCCWFRPRPRPKGGERGGGRPRAPDRGAPLGADGKAAARCLRRDAWAAGFLLIA